MASEAAVSQPDNLIMVCIPSKNGVFSHTFLPAVVGLQTGINASTGLSIVVGKPVDEARNILVEMALESNAKYILFLDDDTMPPPFTIPRLMNLGVKIASGMYYTKSQPPTPVIIKKEIPGGYRNWQYGDVIEVDYIGLGCALIDTSVFKDMKPPYFVYKKGQTGPDDTDSCIGEDVYFCKKAAEAGHKIWVDTVVQCAHEDFPRKTTYFYHIPTRGGAWKGPDGHICFIAPADSEFRQVKTKDARTGCKVCWGFRDGVPAGFEEANEINIDRLREKYADIDEIRVKNLFEFGTSEDSMALLNIMFNLMRHGAKIEIAVPNIVPAIKQIADDTGLNHLQAVYGYPDGKYRSAYTKKCLDELALTAGFKQISVKEEGNSLVLEGVKE